MGSSLGACYGWFAYHRLVYLSKALITQAMIIKLDIRLKKAWKIAFKNDAKFYKV